MSVFYLILYYKYPSRFLIRIQKLHQYTRIYKLDLKIVIYTLKNILYTKLIYTFFMIILIIFNMHIKLHL